MTDSPSLNKAIEQLMEHAAVAGEARIRADQARSDGTITFAIAAAQRNAEDNVRTCADKMVDAYVEARKAGSITPGSPTPEVPN
jgi:hypothetical protein